MPRRHLFLCFLVAPTICLAYGAWFRTVEEMKPGTVSWAFVKWGIFSRSGNLKLVQPLKGCPKSVPLTAWITHRISPRETLSAKAAQHLANQLNRSLGDCFTGVELDVEPLPNLTPWFSEFAKTLRDHLDKRYRLQAAIPSDWPHEMSLNLLSVIDGIDLMIYDTGAKNPTEYQNQVSRALALTKKTSPEKQLTFGFPAYQDRTKKHRPEVENLSHIESLLAARKELWQTLCGPNRKIALYAGWTAFPEEFQIAKRLTSQAVCPK